MKPGEEMKNVSSEEREASWSDDGGKSLLINNGVPRSKYKVSHSSRMSMSQKWLPADRRMRQVWKLPDFIFTSKWGDVFQKKLVSRDGPRRERLDVHRQ